MTDMVSRKQRSDNMRAVRGRDTTPEISVRRIAHRLGYRFRLHRADLPGKPDIVFPRFGKVVFVHGCFWHQHRRCRKGSMPQSNTEFWRSKLQRNVQRDAENLVALKAIGWKVLVIWECETNDEAQIEKKLQRFLGE